MPGIVAGKNSLLWWLLFCCHTLHGDALSFYVLNGSPAQRFQQGTYRRRHMWWVLLLSSVHVTLYVKHTNGAIKPRTTSERPP